MKRHFKWTIRGLLSAIAVGVVIFSTHNLPAGYRIEPENTTIEINGTDFGTFDHIEGLAGLTAMDEKTFAKVSLRRDFVTDPSLYLWAKKLSKSRQASPDVFLVTRNQDGEEISRLALRQCQPLSWTVEVANPALGGYHEMVELAVQKVDIQ